jgi:hypothetical protein
LALLEALQNVHVLREIMAKQMLICKQLKHNSAETTMVNMLVMWGRQQHVCG